MKIKPPQFLGNIIFFIFCALILGFSIRGLPGNPTVTQLNSLTWKDEGPFELSPERGRFTLLYSIIENNSFSFSPQLAMFTAPDVAYSQGKYVSLFAPGLSFITMPGYIIGKALGASQVGTFAMVGVFALLNILLIRLIAIRLGAHPLAATIAGFGFLFATPAFAYAVNLYQHHISTSIILLSAYLLIRYNSFLSLALVWMLCVFSVVIDYPNFFMMLPVGIAALGRLFVAHKTHDGSITYSFPLVKIFTFTGVVIPILFFCWVNVMSYGRPFQLAGALERPMKINEDGTPVLRSELIKKQKIANNTIQFTDTNLKVVSYFANRNMMNGLYIHFISPDRGILIYTPVMLFALFGIFLAWKKKTPFLPLLFSISAMNILLYAMWADPWGGWAFGSRYLIPTYAVLSIFIAIMLTQFRKHTILLAIFFLVLSYSVAVNTLGAITSSRNPPQIEIAGLEKLSGKKEEYTYMRNVEFLSAGRSKSFIFQTVASHYFSAWNYYLYLTLSIVIAAGILMTYLRFFNKQEHAKK